MQLNQPKTALVTGGARRIGAAIVAGLAKAGFDVAIHCNTSRDQAETLAASVRASGRNAVVLAGDLAVTATLDNLVSQATVALGPIGLLVNSASIFEPDALEDFDWPLWDRHFDLHLKAPVMLTRRFAEELPGDMHGLVVNIVDQRVLKPDPRFMSYALSKAALWNATITTAQALAPRIRVNAIGPGPTLSNDRQTAADFTRQAEAVPLRRGPDLAEFGQTIRYLFDTHSVTGQMIAIDGGQHLAWQTPDIRDARE